MIKENKKEIRDKELGQTTDVVVMIYPDTFKFNPETASSNKFMKSLVGVSEAETNTLARTEFEGVVRQLKGKGVNVVVIHSVADKDTPDAVFPNNWFSYHGDTVVLYPMRNASRAIEKQPKKLIMALQDVGISTSEVLDLSYHEDVRGTETVIVDDKKVEVSVCLEALEGTGSMVLDRDNKIAYAIESPRTSKKVFDEWCQEMGYEGVFFHASNSEGPIYHTNVIMGIGGKFAVISLESITDEQEREQVAKSLRTTGKEVIDISLDQVSAFCGNLLEVTSTLGEPRIVMSKTAYNGFTKDQIKKLEGYGEIVALDISTIEIAGGSARCMMAEIFY